VQTNNTMFTGYRYFAARDTKNARKGAIFALCAMAFGTIIWFLPPWVAASIYPDAATHYSGVLGSRSREAVYLVFVERALPAGAVGLLVASLFAATMSTLDSALNRDVGVVIKSFYRPILRPNASSKELMTASLLLSGLFGLIIILMSQYFNTLKELSLFELSMQVATIAQAPMLVPLFFGVFIRKTPDWAAWATVIVGVIVSVIIQNYLTVPVIANAIGFTFTGREVSELVVMYNIFMHLVITGGFFCLTTFFYKEPSGVRKAEIIELFANMDDPVVRENTEDELMIDQMQRSKIGVLVMISGTLIFLLTLVPNPLVGRLMYFVSGLTVLGFGYILKGVQKKIK
jgi:SSS family solute:Na+ symporter